MICQLCTEDKKLIKNSHIIPNFLYRGLFDAKHRLVSINIDDFSDATYHQTGFKDKDILCEQCENEVLSKLERYAANTIFGDHTKLETEQFAGDAIHVPYIRFKNLDYATIKLFLLSILWKSHISKNPFFSQIDLGPKYSEQLRKMIFENDAGPEDAFEVVLVRPDTNGTRPTKSMIAPRCIKEESNTAYVFHINEIMYHFNISPHNKLSMFEKGIIKKDGILDIAIIKGEFGAGYFDSFMGQKIKLNPRHS
jgi:hypothetical protein